MALLLELPEEKPRAFLIDVLAKSPDYWSDREREEIFSVLDLYNINFQFLGRGGYRFKSKVGRFIPKDKIIAIFFDYLSATKKSAPFYIDPDSERNGCITEENAPEEKIDAPEPSIDYELEEKLFRASRTNRDNGRLEDIHPSYGDSLPRRRRTCSPFGFQIPDEPSVDSKQKKNLPGSKSLNLGLFYGLAVSATALLVGAYVGQKLSELLLQN